MATGLPPADQVYCSFCGLSNHQVFQMIAGPAHVCICDQCVELCVQIIDRAYATANVAASEAAAPWFDPMHPMNVIVLLRVSASPREEGGRVLDPPLQVDDAGR